METHRVLLQVTLTADEGVIMPQSSLSISNCCTDGAVPASLGSQVYPRSVYRSLPHCCRDHNCSAGHFTRCLDHWQLPTADPKQVILHAEDWPVQKQHSFSQQSPVLPMTNLLLT